MKTVAPPAADREEFDGVWELPAALNLWQLQSVLLLEVAVTAGPTATDLFSAHLIRVKHFSNLAAEVIFC